MFSNALMIEKYDVLWCFDDLKYDVLVLSVQSTCRVIDWHCGLLL
jgi:hypothetical protein